MILLHSYQFKSIKLWRVLHDAERPGGIWRDGLPEVFVLNELHTPFGPDWQRLSYALNPGMTGDKWRSLYANNRALTNGSGFNGVQPRADHVNMRDLDAPLPAWDKTRLCGGATITGSIAGNELEVLIMDGRGPAPSLSWLQARPWLFYHGVNSTINGITRFPQNDGRDCLVPLAGTRPAFISLDDLQQVTEIADPYWVP